MVKKICQHCNKCVAHRPRQLCWACYYNPAIIQQYSPTRVDGYGTGNVVAKQPRRATSKKPGTRDKVAILMARAKRGESLFHVRDAKFTRQDLA